MNRRPMIGISLTYNNSVLKEIETGEYEISIGRNPDNDIQIDNLAVSGEHAKIIRGLKQYYIQDLSSTNGTFVNGEEIQKVPLRDNDEITIGKHTLLISLKDKKDSMQKLQMKNIETTYKLTT